MNKEQPEILEQDNLTSEIGYALNVSNDREASAKSDSVSHEAATVSISQPNAAAQKEAALDSTLPKLPCDATPLPQAVAPLDTTLQGISAKIPSRPGTFPPDTVLNNRYRIGSVIGTGGFGVIYEAFDQEDNDRRVAVKSLKHNVQDYAMAAKRFEREIALCRQIQSTHAVKIFDSGVADDSTLFYVMEFLEGCTIEDKIKDHEKFSFYSLKQIFLQVLDALGEAHSKNIVHRDMKPSNIWLTETAEDSNEYDVKVLDFGIAKSLSDDQPEGAKLTQTGAWMGSPAYMSPEHLSGRPVTPASDIFAMGLIAIEMLTGYQAVEGDSPMDIALTIISDVDIYIDDWIMQSAIGPMIKKCVQKNAEDRYQDGNAFAEALQALSDDVLKSDFVTVKMNRSAEKRRTIRSVSALSAAKTVTISASEYKKQRDRQYQVLLIIGILLVVLVIAIVLFVKVYVDKQMNEIDDNKEAGDIAVLPEYQEKVIFSAAFGAVMGAAETNRVSINVSSNPPGAQIKRASDGMVIGTTPAMLSLIRSPAVMNLIVSREGFMDYPITLMPLRSETKDVPLIPKMPGMGDTPVLSAIGSAIAQEKAGNTAGNEEKPPVIDNPMPAPETPKQETVKTDTAKKDTAKKDTAKKDTAKKDTAKKDTAKKDTAKKTSKPSSKKTSAAETQKSSWKLDDII